MKLLPAHALACRRVPGTLNEKYYNFDAATEETRSKTQGETTVEDEIELLIRSSIPFVSEDPPRPSKCVLVVPPISRFN